MDLKEYGFLDEYAALTNNQLTRTYKSIIFTHENTFSLEPNILFLPLNCGGSSRMKLTLHIMMYYVYVRLYHHDEDFFLENTIII